MMDLEKIKQMLLKDKTRFFVIFLGVIGIMLIFTSNFSKGKLKENKKIDKDFLVVDTYEYKKQLEENLKNIISEISGVGNTKVLVTLENSMQNVYATEQKKNKEAVEDKNENERSKRQESNEIETKYITIKDSDGTEKALSVMQIQPTVKGVVVICSGGDNIDVKNKVTEAVKTALNITSNKNIKSIKKKIFNISFTSFSTSNSSIFKLAVFFKQRNVNNR